MQTRKKIPADKLLLTSLKRLTLAMASIAVISSAQADTKVGNNAIRKIGDLEIYKAAEGGNINVTMMLDTSGSMSISQVGIDACIGLPSGASSRNTSTISENSTTTPVYVRNLCVNNGKRYEDKLTKLKDALFELMDSPAILAKADKTKIGIGQFSSQSNSDNIPTNADGRTGKIVVPAAILDANQRIKIKNAVASFNGINGTPTAHAYAEAAAYLLGTNTGTTTASGFTNSVKSSKNGQNYISPITSKNSCDGNGIYFLTDGAPNSTTTPSDVMKPALGSFGKDFAVPDTGALPQGSESGNNMPSVGEFAKRLRDASKNPANTSIRTAVVGFGTVFDLSAYPGVIKTLQKPKLDPNTNLPLRGVNNAPIYEDAVDGVVPVATYYDCTVIPVGKIDARNACQWGAKSHPLLSDVGGYGEGGFTSAQSTPDVINSVVNFVSDLNNAIPSSPSGTIVVPDDPYKTDSQLAIAYYPTLQAEVDKNPAIWSGNMKKYSLKSGTLWGKSNQQLFLDVAGTLNPAAVDFWSDKDYSPNNNSVGAGGYLASVKTPSTAIGVTNIRKLYIEDVVDTKVTPTIPVIREFGVNASGKVVVDGKLLSTGPLKDTVTYTDATLRGLLKYLGFSGFDESVPVASLTLTAPSSQNKISGSTIHSTPSAVSYSAKLDANGRVTSERDDYVLFGSSEGALHMVNADDYSAGKGGSENFSFIPKLMLKEQLAALSGGKGKGIGQPYMGVDAPWLVAEDYIYDDINKKVTIDTRTVGNSKRGVFAYGGLRMGGEALYGLDLTKANTDAPSLIFAITPDMNDFKRMGQIWSKPTKAKIKTSASDKGTDVLVFGGGYDTCYENEGFQVGVTDATFATDVKGNSCSTKSEAQGNAVYIINAQTGALIWSASSSGGTKTVTDMKNSVVGEVTVLDRNNDGFMDHIYFSDLGGQVFRGDFTNANNAGGNFTNVRITRILKPAFTGNDSKYNHRFYERPMVSFYRNPTNQRLFALVNVISGDRSSPLSKMRSDNKYADRLYGIMDSDITLPDTTLYNTSFTPTITNLTDTNFAILPEAIGSLTASGFNFGAAAKKVVIDKMDGGTVRGWLYPLIRFDGFYNVKYNKGMGRSDVINSTLYTTVFNPDMTYGKAADCQAKITGGSEREIYCLPYGICMDDRSKNGTGGFSRAGQGFQDLTMGPLNAEKTNQKLFIGTRTLEQSLTDPRVDNNTDPDKKLLGDPDNTSGNGIYQKDPIEPGGDESTNIPLESARYTLTPITWFEVNK